MKYRIVVADVDGTLIAPGDEKYEKISKRLIDAVGEVQKKGVVFSIATARSLNKVDVLIKKLKLNSPIILANGAEIYDCMVEKFIFSSYLQSEKVNEVLDVLKKFPYTIYIDEP